MTTIWSKLGTGGFGVEVKVTVGVHVTVAVGSGVSVAVAVGTGVTNGVLGTQAAKRIKQETEIAKYFIQAPLE